MCDELPTRLIRGVFGTEIIDQLYAGVLLKVLDDNFLVVYRGV